MVRSFEDRTGRAWNVELTVSVLRRVRDRLGVNLYSLADDGFAGLGKLLADPIGLADVLFVICHEVAKKPDATSEEIQKASEAFGDSLAGDSLGKAGQAFQEAVIDFFPDQEGRETVRNLLAKTNDVRKLAMAEASRQIDAATPEQLLEGLRATLGLQPVPTSSSTSGSGPESSASTPGPSVTASSP